MDFVSHLTIIVGDSGLGDKMLSKHKYVQLLCDDAGLLDRKVSEHSFSIHLIVYRRHHDFVRSYLSEWSECADREDVYV